MAANFWSSSQRRLWLLDRRRLLEAKADDLKYLTEPELMKVHIFYANVIYKLAKKLSLRQQIIATALTYFKRFYVKNSLRTTDPLLVAATSLYLACKTEEVPHHIKAIVNEMRKLLDDFSSASHDGSTAPGSTGGRDVAPKNSTSGGNSKSQHATSSNDRASHSKVNHRKNFFGPGTPPASYYDNHRIAEMEFYLMEELEFWLIVYHPYRTLREITDDLNLDQYSFLSAWCIINDAYRGDLCLLFPPHIIALSALYLTIVLRMPQQHASPETLASAREADPNPSTAFKIELSGGTQPVGTKHIRETMINWFAELNVDLEEIADAAQEMLFLYDVWRDYADNQIPTLLTKLRTTT